MSTKREVSTQVRKLETGYNCMGHVWLGSSDRCVAAVFDTGATRGTIDKAFLQSLVLDPATEDCIVAVQPIQKMPCRGMSNKLTEYVENVVSLRISFRENSLGRSVDKVMEFLVFPDSN